MSPSFLMPTMGPCCRQWEIGHFVGFDIDINNYLNDIVVDEFGSLEEFGLLSVVEASKGVLSIPAVGADTTIFQVNKAIKGVTAVNDIADIFGDGAQVARLEYPQAVALETDGEIIMLDKEVWFSELTVIKSGGCPSVYRPVHVVSPCLQGDSTGSTR